MHNSLSMVIRIAVWCLCEIFFLFLFRNFVLDFIRFKSILFVSHSVVVHEVILVPVLAVIHSHEKLFFCVFLLKTDTATTSPRMTNGTHRRQGTVENVLAAIGPLPLHNGATNTSSVKYLLPLSFLLNRWTANLSCSPAVRRNAIVSDSRQESKV